MGAQVEVDSIRKFLNGRGRYGLDTDKLEVVYVKLRQNGPELAMLEVPSRTHGTVGLTAHWMDTNRGVRIARRINRRYDDDPGLELPGGLDRPAVYSESVGALFTAFPADRRLRSLAHIVDAGYMVDRLERALDGRRVGGSIESLAVDVVRYKSDRKCLVRYRISWRGGGWSLPELVWAKVSKDSVFAKSKATLGAIYLAASELGLEIPEPIAVLDDLNLELFSHINGDTLTSRLEAGRCDGVGAAIGHSMRRFHELDLTLERSWTNADRLEFLDDKTRQLAEHMPVAAEQIDRLALETRARLISQPDIDPVPIHGDLHGDNILIDNNRVGLVDFEDCAMGDPANDLGTLYAQLTDLAMRTPQRADRIRTEKRALIEAYDPTADEHLRRRIETSAAIECLHIGYKFLRYQNLSSERHATNILAAGEQLLIGGLR